MTETLLHKGILPDAASELATSDRQVLIGHHRTRACPHDQLPHLSLGEASPYVKACRKIIQPQEEHVERPLHVVLIARRCHAPALREALLATVHAALHAAFAIAHR